MSTDLERRLREALHDDAQRARLVNPDRPRLDGAVPLSDTPRRARRTGRGLVALAAAVALIVGATVVLLRDGRDRKVEVSTTSDPTVTTAPHPTVTTAPGPTRLFTDLAPDATVPLPPAPTGPLAVPGVFWTGTELIVWGERSAPDESPGPEGAAFDPEAGRWRTIAPAPVGRGDAVVWTGSEMIVWGGSGGNAAYDPETDTWRLLPRAPISAFGASTGVWTGNEVIVLAGLDDRMEVAAYNPATDAWRALATPNSFLASHAVWTGTNLLTIVDTRGPSPTGPDVAGLYDGGGLRLARYDPSADAWHVDAGARYASLVGVPGVDGVSRTVLAMPVEPGEPVDLLDASGTPIGSLPPHPVDLDGSTTAAYGMWLGDEAVFWILGADDWLLPSPKPWALNPVTGAWRPLPDDVESASSVGTDLRAVAVGDVLLTTNGQRGIAYRAPTSEGE